jgi:hypothetical protein
VGDRPTDGPTDRRTQSLIEVLFAPKKICYDAHSVKNNISNAIPGKMLAVFAAAAAAAGATRYATATYKVF